MIRDSLAPGSAYGLMPVTPGNGFDFQYRTPNGAAAAGNVSGGAVNAAPNNWVRLARTNNTFDAYVSADGVNWTAVGTPATLAFTNAVYYVGLAVCAHNNALVSTATFDNVTVNGFTYTDPPPVVVLTAPVRECRLHRRRQRDNQRRRRRALRHHLAGEFLRELQPGRRCQQSALHRDRHRARRGNLHAHRQGHQQRRIDEHVRAGQHHRQRRERPALRPHQSRNHARLFQPADDLRRFAAGLALPNRRVQQHTGHDAGGGLDPYTPNVALWSDGAAKLRYLAVPGGGGATRPGTKSRLHPPAPGRFPPARCLSKPSS